ncbi:hypothetical protein [Flavobacterium algicola]|uniref:hypothetical protein n=1 Tax=Flavobacterium algicola TaxID=556529 RepID=UPI001EFCDFE1|nr:hypothetical protein [Flavobacterium algicola]MCG9791087.1 hypothetical protein [Flavobacterium algicola]
MKNIKIIAYCLIFVSFTNKIVAQSLELYPQVWFNEQDAKDKLAIGTATISGTAFTREVSRIQGQSQKHKAKANTKVLLFPMTEYIDEATKLQKIVAEQGGRVVMSEKAFSYRLETITDANGNFVFHKMKPGTYYLQCNVEFVGHDVAQKQVGRTDYYNGYGYSGSSAIYQAYNYSYDANHLLTKFVEVKKEGELIDADLKPNLWFKNYKIIGATFSSGDKCGRLDGNPFGKCTEYYENGQARIVAKWKKGAQEGETIEYYPNGAVQVKSNWKNGQKNGTASFYSKDNSVIKTEIYKNDILVSTKNK